MAHYVANVLGTSALVNLHGRQNANGILEGQGQEEVRLSQLSTENTNPETVGHPHVVARQMGETGCEGLTGDILTAVLLQIASKEGTEGLDREEDGCQKCDDEVYNTQSEADRVSCALWQLIQETEDNNARNKVDDEDTQEEEETLAQMLSSSPTTRNVKPFSDSRKNLNESGENTSKTDGGQVPRGNRLIVKLLLIVRCVECWSVVSSEEPERTQMDDPDTVEVGDHVEPGSSLLVSLEESLLPHDVLQLGPTFSDRNIDETGFVLEGNSLNTFGVPEELVHIIITNDLVVVILTTNVLAIHDLISLITAVLIQRSDDLVEVREFFHGLDAVLAFR